MLSARCAPLLVLAMVSLVSAAPPTVGDKAPDFALSTVEGKSVRLSEVIAKGPVVLVVLRGYPVTSARSVTGRFKISYKSRKPFSKWALVW
jgi:hypothetical protein